MKPALLPVTQNLTIAGIGLTECPVCSAMIVRERLQRHADALHPDWTVVSGGPEISIWAER